MPPYVFTLSASPENRPHEGSRRNRHALLVTAAARPWHTATGDARDRKAACSSGTPVAGKIQLRALAIHSFPVVSFPPLCLCALLTTVCVSCSAIKASGDCGPPL